MGASAHIRDNDGFIMLLLKDLALVNVYKSIPGTSGAVGLYITISFQLMDLACGKHGDFGPGK